MLLVVLTTVIISIVAVFAQIVSVQATKIYQAQNGFMQAMLTWHGAAVDLVHVKNPTGFATFFASSSNTTGCLLTSLTTSATGFPPSCSSYVGSPATLAASNLPSGWNFTPYTFYSVAFQATSVETNVVTVGTTGTTSVTAANDYVLTFVCATPYTTTAPIPSCMTDSNGYLQLPGGTAASTSVGFTARDLMAQLQRGTADNVTYGIVTTVGSTQILYQMAGMGSATVSGLPYAVPSWVPSGTIGILSLAN